MGRMNTASRERRGITSCRRIRHRHRLIKEKLNSGGGLLTRHHNESKMATLSPPVTIHDPLAGRGGRGGDPPITHGGGDGNGGNGSPDFFRRLRRARVG